ncbi:hypothetical protein F8388_009273 [Cannabis sativa]|uniref:Kinesin motor domain-containing protein n=1 Tax=Cannabis sativa TaxID=3483 RepID=A0A7J6GK46_CANSA|nr:hypothetical protein G4B88_016960 [Cannabis sativa]KAF4383242.1 hypothetical protein F8388_009273 [Cannabis sativa]
MGSFGGGEQLQGQGECDEKIFVSIRLRPLNQKEAARNDVSDWECINDTTIIYRNNLSVSERSMYPTAYTFDRVFSFDSSTRQVYQEGAKDVALSVVGGINASIFAYGQTSSGKTYTMSGITEYTVADIYDYVEKHNERDYVMKLSAMEIYNESVRDLLSADNTPLRLLDDPERGTIVERLTEETLRDWNHFKELLSVCEAQRQIGETSLNEASSRSHQIIRLIIESSTREFLGRDKSSSLSATVNFVDLAGSERASQTLSAGARLKEGCHINRSLLTLGTVIRKLSKGRNGHVPYRDSKLTRILQSSLGGNARTAIICTLSPARSHVEQSRNTLLFASCAKEVATNAQVNVVMSDKALVKKLQRELARLESELSFTGSTAASSDSSALLIEKDLQIEKLKKEISEVILQRDAAQSQVKDLLRIVEEDRRSESVDLDQYYPKLRVRNSWDFENRAPRTLVFAGSKGLDHHTKTNSFDTDGQSNISDDSFFQLQDFDQNSVPTDSPSPHLSVRIPNFIPKFVEIDMPEENKENYDRNSDDTCKEVRCIEVEEQNTNRHVESNISSYTSPKRSLNSIVSSPKEKEAISELTVVENGAVTNEEMRSPTLTKNEVSNSFQNSLLIPSSERPSQCLVDKSMSGFSCWELTRSRSCKARLSSQWFDTEEKDESTPPVIVERNFTGRAGGLPKKVPQLNYDVSIETLSTNGSSEEMSSNNDSQKTLLINDHLPETLSVNDSQKTLLRNDSPESLSINDSPETLSRNDSQKTLSRHDSQKISLANDSQKTLSRNGSPERNDSQKTLLRNDSQKTLSRNGSQKTLSRINSQKTLSRNDSHSTSHTTLSIDDSHWTLSTNASFSHTNLSRNGSPKTLSRNASHASALTDSVDELKVQDIKSSHDDENTNTSSSSSRVEETEDYPLEKTIPDSEVLKTEDKLIVPARNVKDVGLDPIQNEEVGSPPKWPSEFKRLQREVIELWHACNASLVHRTYFFLLFRGDQTDSIYIEVELRRMSFLRDIFSRGGQTVEDGRTLSYASSVRALCRERLMLAKQLLKKLSKQERENIYLKWGIALNTKNRRLQLAHRLWSSTNDINHITESAAVVVKLVGSGEPEEASKEMFGLRFTPRRIGDRKYYGLK